MVDVDHISYSLFGELKRRDEDVVLRKGVLNLFQSPKEENFNISKLSCFYDVFSFPLREIINTQRNYVLFKMAFTSLLFTH